MPRIEADFSTVSTSFDPLPAADYQCTVTGIEEKAARSGLPMLVVTLTVEDPAHPEHNGRLLFDNIVLKTSKGEVNKIALGQIKSYAEAILGEEAANSPSGIDTDELLHGTVVAVVSQRSYEDNGETKLSNDIKKILAVR